MANTGTRQHENLPGLSQNWRQAMYEAWFSRPVPVSTGIAGGIQNLSNANQAVDLMTRHWRGAGSQKHLAALRAAARR